ncbi:TIGR02281 family clan AA aspartic protease [Sphingomonas sp. 28-63-12]|uniref:retropepsin-like aspartic protease family protein n=1 Tax=Sphingomonas sp. 28-63-12 TaxID=1970434 RepID=UPI000BDB1FE7|nr:MAG: hypothetical protein B7Y47_06925 [Sphingomonas sp. 28-63-12]
MRVALFLVAIAGIAIGLSLPPVATVAPPPVGLTSAAKPPPSHRDMPVETVLDRAPSGHFLAIADVNDEPIRFVVDTGADTVALTQEDARRAHVDFDPGQFSVVGRGAGGDVRGQEVRIASIVLDGKRATDIGAVVLEQADISLLGHSYLRRIANVQISGDQMRLR